MTEQTKEERDAIIASWYTDKIFSGVALTRPDSYNPGKTVVLEPGIGRVILILETLGFTSVFSCEGHDNEIKGREKPFVSVPYVSFTISENIVDDLRVVQALSSIMRRYGTIGVNEEGFGWIIQHLNSREKVNKYLYSFLNQFYETIGGEEILPEHVEKQKPIDLEARAKLVAWSQERQQQIKDYLERNQDLKH